MAYGDPYMSVAEFKERVGAVGTGTDAALLAVLTAASRWVDTECGRRFDQTAAPETRYFIARDARIVDTDDFVSLTDLATDDGTRLYASVWAVTDYDLMPVGAAGALRPYNGIRTTPTGLRIFYTAEQRGVRVTAVWGWPAIPEAVKEATFLVANRQKSLWNAPFGVTGGGQTQSSMRFNASDLDPYICGMLAGVKVMPV